MKSRRSIMRVAIAAAAITSGILLGTNVWRNAFAADHAEAPNCAHDAGADIGDVYAFLDPGNSNIVLIMTIHGFIVPAENVNIGYFDPDVKFRFEVETTGDAKVDQVIDIKFDHRTSTSTGQLATVTLPNKHTFTAYATAPTLATSPNAPIITTSSPDNVTFFAGPTDDPFFFDIPAFNRFAASVRAGAPDATHFNRGRDAFAGYNTMSIALSIPQSFFTVKATNHNIGIAGRTLRATQTQNVKGPQKATGLFRSLDRMGVPAINTVLIPFAKKDRYNAASTTDDAKGEFAKDILDTLTAFGVNATYQQVLAGVAVSKGDFLHLNLTIPNSGSGRGLPPGVPDAFPNGRRLSDDVIDIILTLVNNGAQLGDNVDGNDVPFLTTFPFLAPPQQPRANGVVDDNTRN